VDTQHLVKNSLDISVRQLAQGRQRFSRTRTRFEFLAYSLSLVVRFWSERGKRSYGSLHRFFSLADQFLIEL
jgi:hypothetical protein